MLNIFKAIVLMIGFGIFISSPNAANRYKNYRLAPQNTRQTYSNNRQTQQQIYNQRYQVSSAQKYQNPRQTYSNNQRTYNQGYQNNQQVYNRGYQTLNNQGYQNNRQTYNNNQNNNYNKQQNNWNYNNNLNNNNWNRNNNQKWNGTPQRNGTPQNRQKQNGSMVTQNRQGAYTPQQDYKNPPKPTEKDKWQQLKEQHRNQTNDLARQAANNVLGTFEKKLVKDFPNALANGFLGLFNFGNRSKQQSQQQPVRTQQPARQTNNRQNYGRQTNAYPKNNNNRAGRR